MLTILYLYLENSIWGTTQLSVVNKLSDDHLWSWSKREKIELLKRISYQPFLLFIKTYNILFIFSIISFFFIKDEYKFWSYFALFSVLLYWFGTTKVHNYEPMPLAGRMTLTAFPGFCIISSRLLAELINSFKKSNSIKKTLVNIIIPIVLASPLIIYIIFAFPHSDPSSDSMDIIKNNISSSTQKVLVLCTDNRSPRSLLFYFGYKIPSKVTLQNSSEITKNSLKNYDQTYLYHNEFMFHFLQSAYNEKVDYKFSKDLNLRPLLSQDGVEFYKVMNCK